MVCFFFSHDALAYAFSSSPPTKKIDDGHYWIATYSGCNIFYSNSTSKKPRPSNEEIVAIIPIAGNIWYDYNPCFVFVKGTYAPSKDDIESVERETEKNIEDDETEVQHLPEQGRIVYFIFDKTTHLLHGPLLEDAFFQNENVHAAAIKWKPLSNTWSEEHSYTIMFATLFVLSLFFYIILPIVFLIVFIRLIRRFIRFVKSKKENTGR